MSRFTRNLNAFLIAFTLAVVAGKAFGHDVTPEEDQRLFKACYTRAHAALRVAGISSETANTAAGWICTPEFDGTLAEYSAAFDAFEAAELDNPTVRF